MSWTGELENIYNIISERETGEILPLYHSTAKAQIEITLNENGEFCTARQIDKAEAETIIPVTEASGSRSSGITPMPFADKLLYIAGDLSDHFDGKRSDNHEHFKAYMDQLKGWCESEYSHRSVTAVYNYLNRSELISDLIKSGVLTVNSETGKLDEAKKIGGISQVESFVRFIVNGTSDEPRTWKDTGVYESFISYNGSIGDNKQLCYALGKGLVPTYNHPKKIRNAGDQAKLLSANDESGFTYRGRFSNKEEAVSVSYEFSQKIHNAMKWLVANHSVNINTLSLMVWANTLQLVPDITRCTSDYFDEDDDDENNTENQLSLTTEALDAKFEESLRRYLYGHNGDFQSNARVMIMALDSATKGRLSMSMYSEIEATRFYENVSRWHVDTKWLCYNGKYKKTEYTSFSPGSIAECAFGTEQNGKIEFKGALRKDVIMRLIPCIAEGRKIPIDIVNALYQRASTPLAYEEKYNHRRVLETACGMIKKSYIDYNNAKGDDYMAYDPNNTDRSYLFGCLLAIADKAESDTYEKGDTRITNARRYWSAFAARPYQTWGVIEEKLRPYMDKLNIGARISYEKRINEITSKMSAEDFSDNSRLAPLYLLGYHHYTTELFKKKEEEQ